MKKEQKVLVISLIITIAVLLIAGGVYFSLNGTSKVKSFFSTNLIKGEQVDLSDEYQEGLIDTESMDYLKAVDLLISMNMIASDKIDLAKSTAQAATDGSLDEIE